VSALGGKRTLATRAQAPSSRHAAVSYRNRGEVAQARRPGGGSKRPPQRKRSATFRLSAAAALHRACDRGQPGHDPDRRALFSPDPPCVGFGTKSDLHSPPIASVPLRHRPILNVVTQFCPNHPPGKPLSEQAAWPDASKTSLRSRNTPLSML
jgi:hypothetical protein